VTTFIIFILILGLLVLVHELGHFIVAKRNGVPSEEFGFGFPPRIVGFYKDKEGKRRWVFGSGEIDASLKEEDETVYSLNLIPLGGFVKIRGEDEENGEKDEKSFVNQPAWVRFKILFAGVAMNFLLAIVLFSAAFQIGLPESISDTQQVDDSKVQIAQVSPGSPADEMGLEMGDEVVSIETTNGVVKIDTISGLQETVEQNKGEEITVNVMRADNGAALTTIVRETPPEGEGLLGVQLVRTTFAQYGFFESIWLAIKTTFMMVIAIIVFLFDMIVGLFRSEPISADVAGPVGIAVMTGKMAELGFAYLLQFTALLSVNLAVINLFPFPALDGGRILFLGIEKIKGSPINRKIEGAFNTVGFFLLIGLMIFITIQDFSKFIK